MDCLSKRKPVAVDALEVAFVGDVDFDARAAGSEGFTEAVADP